MSHHSIADTIEWSVDYSSHDAVPGLRWDALDASAAFLVARSTDEQVLSVTDEHDWVETGSKLTLRLPPNTLPDPGVYQVQTVLTLTDETSVAVPSSPDYIRVRDSLGRA